MAAKLVMNSMIQLVAKSTLVISDKRMAISVAKLPNAMSRPRSITNWVPKFASQAARHLSMVNKKSGVRKWGR